MGMQCCAVSLVRTASRRVRKHGAREVIVRGFLLTVQQSMACRALLRSPRCVLRCSSAGGVKHTWAVCCGVQSRLRRRPSAYYQDKGGEGTASARA